MRVKICEYCCKEFELKSRKNKQRFCSKRCGYDSPIRNEKLRGKLKGRRVSPETEFKKDQEPIRYWLGKKNPAMSQRNKEYYVGSGNPAWKGGISKTPAYRVYYNRKRKLRLKNVEGSFSLKEWEAVRNSQNKKCAICRTHESKRKLTVDHIIPIARSGTNYIKNIQALCGSCNSRKHAKIL